jgi:ATP phosphoribosyltransferase regulatory subunit
MTPLFNFKSQLTYLKNKQALLETITSLASEKGYLLFESEDFESYESFKRINDRIDPKEMVKVTNAGGDVLVFRPDVTTQVIDQLMPRWDGHTPLKLYYDTTIYTQKETGIEGKRQFGVEYICKDTFESDKAVMRLASDILNKIHEPYVLEIGNQRFLNGLFNALNLTSENLRTLKSIITYKNQYDLESFVEAVPITPPMSSLLLNLLAFEGDLNDIEKKLKDYTLTDPMKKALDEIKSVMPYLNGDVVTVDLSLLSQFDYYEGIVFKAYISSAPTAVMKGGRYAPLKKDASAIGFSLDIAPLLKGRETHE